MDSFGNKFNQEEFNNFILKNKVIGFFDTPKKLSSGKMTHWYVNWRRITDDAFLMEKVINFVIDFVDDHSLKPDYFYGVPDGATSLGLLTTFESARYSRDYREGSHVLSAGRKEPKGHGDEADRYFVGTPRGQTIVIEDVTTTGDSLARGLKSVRDHAPQAELIAAITLTDRQEKIARELTAVPSDRGITVNLPKSYTTVGELIQQTYNIPFLAMSHALELLPEAYERQKPGMPVDSLVGLLASEGIDFLK